MTKNRSASTRRVRPAALPAQGDSAGFAVVGGAVAEGGVEPEELEDALAVRAAAAASSLVAASGQVPHELQDALPRRAVVARGGRGRFGEDAVQRGDVVAELPVHDLGRPLPLPSLLPLSTYVRVHV